MKYPSFYLYLLLSFLIVGFFVVVPNTTLAQDPDGCCINPGGNCGNDQGGADPCENLQPGEFCEVPESTCQNQNFTFQEGLACVKRDNGPPPDSCEPFGCCQLGQDFVQLPETTCVDEGGTYLNDGPCDLPPTGCCETEGPTCNDGVIMADCTTGEWTVGGSCNGDMCGDPEPIDGCCQIQSGQCDDLTNVQCADMFPAAPFFPGGMCMEGQFCEPPPTGCCVIEQGVCDIETENECNNQGGEWQGPDTMCGDNPQCVLPTSQVPSISQWGMIAVAGLLGVYSLIMIRRRNKYNLG